MWPEEKAPQMQTEGIVEELIVIVIIGPPYEASIDVSWGITLEDYALSTHMQQEKRWFKAIGPGLDFWHFNATFPSTRPNVPAPSK